MLGRILVFVLVCSVFLPAMAADIQFTFERASETELDNPHDIKLSPDGRYLLVSDVGNNRVVFLDPETLDYVADFGGDHQRGTHDVDFDADGRVYVADTHNNRVTIYELKDTDAELVGTLSDKIRGPEGVLAHPNGRIYVAGAWSGNVVAYENGNIVAELGGLSSPHDVERTAENDIWLADAGNDRMLLLSPELEIKQILEGAPYNFNGVRYQDVLSDGTLIAADKNNHQIKVIAGDGTLLKILGSGNAERGDNKFTTPEGVEVEGNTVWFSDSGNDRIVKYTISRD